MDLFTADPETPVRLTGNKGKVAPTRDHLTPVKAVSMALLVCENVLRAKRRDDSDSSTCVRLKALEFDLENC